MDPAENELTICEVNLRAFEQVINPDNKYRTSSIQANSSKPPQENRKRTNASLKEAYMSNTTCQQHLSSNAYCASVLIHWMQKKGLIEIDIEKLETCSPAACGMKRQGRTAIRQVMQRLCTEGYFKYCGLAGENENLWVIVRAPC